jgi:hypothetical protein
MASSIGIATKNLKATLATESTNVQRMASVMLPMWLATMKSSVAPTLVRDVSDEDVVVAP